MSGETSESAKKLNELVYQANVKDRLARLGNGEKRLVHYTSAEVIPPKNGCVEN